jgi:thioredoxin reductase (NADPH)
MLIAGDVQGGQLTTTTDVENWPADVQGVQGPELMERFMQHAQRFNTRLVSDHIVNVDLKSRPFVLTGKAGSYTCDALIIATSSSAKYLGLPSEQAFLGRCVSGCATCDGFFFVDQDVCVVGGGNTAVEEAQYLTNIASKVTLIHRRDKFRAEPILLDRLKKKIEEGKIELKVNCVVEQIVGGDSGVTGVELRDHAQGSSSARLFHRDRAPAQYCTLRRAASDGRRLYPDPLGSGGLRNGGQRAGCICRRRRPGPRLQAGHHQRGKRLHGCPGCHAISGILSDSWDEQRRQVLAVGMPLKNWQRP